MRSRPRLSRSSNLRVRPPIKWPIATQVQAASIEARRVAGVAAPGEGPPPFVIGLNRPDRMVVIAEALMRRGYSDRAVEKVLGLNFRRVFAETWTA